MVTEKKFGRTLDGQDIMLYSLTNANGMQADVTNYGAILVNLLVANKEGKFADVVLGYDRAKDYFVNGSCFGATIGPIANRTEGGTFEMDGTCYHLVINDGNNNLHTHGELGLHKTLWKGEMKEAENAVTFTATMKDGYLGLPGNRTFQVTYKLTEDNAIEIHYQATTDKKTVVNMTNHSYFNLKGHDSETSVEDVKVWVNASRYTRIKPGAIPTGEIADVAGTPLDFTTMKCVYPDMNTDFGQVAMVKGFDHNYVIDDYEPGKLQKVAELVDDAAGRSMEVYTDLPGVQVYTANNMEPELGKGDALYPWRGGICFETQYFPNCAKEPNFIQPYVDKGEVFTSTTIYKFK